MYGLGDEIAALREEVERLREHSRDLQGAWAQAKKDLHESNNEVKRLRDELADLRGDGFPEEPEWTL